MKTKEVLLQEYNLFLNSEDGFRATVKKMKFNYKGPGCNTKRKSILEALTFWRFVRERFIFIEDKMLFLSCFVSDKNIYIKTLAQMESLPTKVWRKILWRENIDFPNSGEAFLRRLSAEQMEAIENNYDDYKQGAIPRVYQKSLRDKLMVTFGVINFDNIDFEPHFKIGPDAWTDNRYETRNAWAYNLLGIDFGFGLYPKGDNDDTKITNKSFTRFLSVKEHVNDFTVNQEDGKYWWMYKTVRSNYVWFPKEDVKLSTHVCPGFWFTLLIHLLFWVVSPLLFAYVLPKWDTLLTVDDIYWGKVDPINFIISTILMAISIVTPSWLMFAIGKFWATNLIKLLEWGSSGFRKWIGKFDSYKRFSKWLDSKVTQFGKSMQSFVERNEEELKALWLTFKKVLGYLFITSCVISIAAGYYYFGVFLNQKTGMHIFVGPLFCLALILLFIYVIYVIREGEHIIDYYFDDILGNENRKLMQLVGVIGLGGLIAGLLDIGSLVSSDLIPIIKGLAMIIFGMFVTMTFALTAVVIMMAVVPLSLYGLFWIMDPKNEELFAKFSKFIRYSVVAYLILCVYVIYQSYQMSGSYSGSYEVNWFAAIASVSIIFVLPFYLFTLSINTETIDDRQKAAKVVGSLNHYLSLSSIFKRFRVGKVAERKWLKALSIDEVSSYADSVYRFAADVFPDHKSKEQSKGKPSFSYYRRKIVEKLLLENDSVFNTELMSLKTADFLTKIKDEDERLEFAILMVVDGLIYEEAKDVYHSRKETAKRKEEFKERFTGPVMKFISGIGILLVSLFLYVFVIPVKFIFKTLIWEWICVRIWRFGLTLWDLFWFFYKEACPHIAEKKSVEV